MVSAIIRSAVTVATCGHSDNISIRGANIFIFAVFCHISKPDVTRCINLYHVLQQYTTHSQVAPPIAFFMKKFASAK